MILLIALVPALGVFVAAAITESKFKTTVAALIAAAVGVFTGDPAYMVLDLLFVIIVYWISMSTLGGDSGAKPSSLAQKPEPAVGKRDSDVGSTIGVLGALGVLVYLIFGSGSSNKPAVQPVMPAAIQSPAATSARPYIPAKSAAMPTPELIKTQPKRPPKSPLQSCLEIKSEDKMTKCLEGLG